MMMKYMPISFLFLVLQFSVYAQNCGHNISGTKTLYQPQQKKLTPAPVGFEPVFVNHVGRHGARHLTKAVDASFTWKMLIRADSLNALTAKGKLLKQMAMKLQKVEQPNLKFISSEGEKEQQQLGARMVDNYKAVFQHSGNIKITTTKEVRTEQSAKAFLEGAKIDSKSPKISFENNNTDELRFYDVAPAYSAFEENGDWQKQILLLEEKNHIEQFNKNLAKKFFTKKFLTGIKTSEVNKFIDDIFGFASIVPSIETEIKAAGFVTADLDFYALFTCKELETLNLMDTASDYLMKGPGTDNMGIQVIIAAPLLVDFLNTTQNYIDKRSISANLRFGHAETIGPFAALLGMKGASTSSKSILNFQQVYQADKVIPLSSNIDWILYGKNSSEDYLIKFLLNEKEVHIQSLQTTTFPYYNWKDVRNFYLQKLKSLKVGLNDDMHQYLLNLK
ncbi:histidine-type phosphatase [Mucilaginibacter arboris]|uniref:Multiple inositol polyphosphate phosphatase 1 n=1 Tax=Mucilaginibacter arboris TaxID=2682090 RepID=A0A7K1SYC7_9SPHI|nr:histidine-type phosphatase [Mucilaginibacter arboris]MVN22268.1 histidine-type phosphatase [Mucilaginibacter arboris]